LRSLHDRLWHYVTTVPARGDETYSVIAPTLCDSSASGICYSVFFVSAMTTDPLVYFDSAPDSGYSIDNLAPSVPQGFSVSYHTGSGNRLTWLPAVDEDFRYFKIYRGTDSGFLPDEETFADATTDTLWSDPLHDSGEWHYKLSAVDFAGNESEATPPDVMTGAQEPGLPTRFALGAIAPNPANAATTARFSLPEERRVELVIINLQGRRVRTLVNEVFPAGAHEIRWDGTDGQGWAVASGTYLLRMRAGDFVDTRLMMLVK